MAAMTRTPPAARAPRQKKKDEDDRTEEVQPSHTNNAHSPGLGPRPRRHRRPGRDNREEMSAGSAPHHSSPIPTPPCAPPDDGHPARTPPVILLHVPKRGTLPVPVPVPREPRSRTPARAGRTRRPHTLCSDVRSAVRASASRGSAARSLGAQRTHNLYRATLHHRRRAPTPTPPRTRHACPEQQDVPVRGPAPPLERAATRQLRTSMCAAWCTRRRRAGGGGGTACGGSAARRRA
ncbi:hypothetical protein B0H17DRAFT_1338052 [Mycena rosella]|uniref:Uncharacterized protein n=1 Tax=Mycena rosella TaxID=1033263 RepID=A0AAD7CRH0_MYCRO|nr:hypothetical protein B0H17DRAFT_1338052 [Mycena rosella]